MTRARKMCKTCPFRGISESEKRELAVVDPDAWPCHTEHPFGDGDMQCRGHYEAQKKYPVLPHEAERWRSWVTAATDAIDCSRAVPKFRD
jgi:hypothetical protein